MNGMKVWAEYLFPILDDAPEEVQFLISDEDITQMMAASGHRDVILDEDNGIYEKGDRFKSFHHQACQLISRKALFADFLLVWLKKCVVPSPSHDRILSWVLFSLRSAHL